MDKELFLEILKNDLIWLVLGGLISSDSNMTKDDRDNNINRLIEIQDLCDTSEIVNILGRDKADRIKDYVINGVKILDRENQCEK